MKPQDIEKRSFEIITEELGTRAFPDGIAEVVKRVIPPLGNETITLLKDTSLVYILAMNDLMRVTRAFVQRDFDTTPFLVAAVFYLLCTAILTKILAYIEKRYAVYED